MATIIIHNGDIQGALRTLKNEQQKEGTFRYIKAKKSFKNKREKALERTVEIIRRKLKDKREKAATSAYNGVVAENPKPFVFRLANYIVKVFNNGVVGVYTLKNKKINEVMLNNADFDNIEKLVKKVKAEEE